jgi:hypothetical protein
VFEDYVWSCWSAVVSRISGFTLDFSHVKGLEGSLSLFHNFINRYEFTLGLKKLQGNVIVFRTTDPSALQALWASPAVWCEVEKMPGLLIGPLYFLNHHCKSSLMLRSESFPQIEVKLTDQTFPHDSPKELYQPFADREVLVRYGADPPENCICSSCMIDLEKKC